MWGNRLCSVYWNRGLYYEVLCLGYALACAQAPRPNFLFDFRRKGMREREPFFLTFFFLFIFLFSFKGSKGFFLFSVFSFSCFVLSLLLPKAQCAELPSPAHVKPNSYMRQKSFVCYIIVLFERNTAFIRICGAYLLCALFWKLAYVLPHR